jgi:hypothetical protein
VALAISKERLRLVEWRRLRRGKLFGFAVIDTPIGLLIHDVPVLQGKDGPWACVPTKAQIDRHGRQRYDAVTGRPAYGRVLSWRSRRFEQEFSRRVVELVRAAHPEDLAD